MLKTLDKFDLGESGVIKTVGGEGRIRRRLFDMGVTPGATVVLKKRAPLGDPIEVTLRGYELTLRKAEAIFVELQVADEAKAVEEVKVQEEPVVEEKKEVEKPTKKAPAKKSTKK